MSLLESLLASKEIIDNIKNDAYAQRLYGVLCTNLFYSDNSELIPIGCGWRSAKLVVENLRLAANTEDDFTNQPAQKDCEPYIYWYFTNCEEDETTKTIKDTLQSLGWVLTKIENDLIRTSNH